MEGGWNKVTSIVESSVIILIKIGVCDWLRFSFHFIQYFVILATNRDV